MSRSDSVEQVRNRFIQLAREIEEYSQANVPEQTFFKEFLKRVIKAVGAQAGAVWLRNGRDQLDLVCNQGLQQTGFYDDPKASTLNQQLLTDVISHGQACTFSPDDSRGAKLPTKDLILLAAIKSNQKCIGVVQIFQKADTPKQVRPEFLQFVEQMCRFAGHFMDRQSTVALASKAPSFAEQFKRCVLKLHRTLDVSDVAATAASIGRQLTGCDRLSVTVQWRRKSVIKAISDQRSVDHRSNLVRNMAAMSSRVIAMREPLTYTGELDHFPTQIEEPLRDFVQESGSKMIMIVPLFKTHPLIDLRDDLSQLRRKEKKRTPIGGLIIEQFFESRPQPELIDKVNLLADHTATALSNARSHQDLILMPLWRFCGRCFTWIEGRNQLKVAAVLAVIAGVILAMMFTPYEYRIDGEGRLMPVIQRDVFAPWNGKVDVIKAENKDFVNQGQELLILSYDPLNSELLAAQVDLDGKRNLLFALQAELDEAFQTPENEDDIRLQGKIEEIRIEIEGAREEVKTLKKRASRLTVLAPISGRIATFQVDQLLQDRPVRRGDILLQIMDTSGDWHLELEVEERRLGHLLRAQETLGTKRLPVEFVLSTASDMIFCGELKNIGTRTDASNLTGSIVEVLVEVDTNKLPNLRIGAEVQAKISCGERSLGYVLLGDLIEFFQKYFWL